MFAIYGGDAGKVDKQMLLESLPGGYGLHALGAGEL